MKKEKLLDENLSNKKPIEAGNKVIVKMVIPDFVRSELDGKISNETYSRISNMLLGNYIHNYIARSQLTEKRNSIA